MGIQRDKDRNLCAMIGDVAIRGGIERFMRLMRVALVGPVIKSWGKGRFRSPSSFQTRVTSLNFPNLSTCNQTLITLCIDILCRRINKESTVHHLRAIILFGNIYNLGQLFLSSFLPHFVTPPPLSRSLSLPVSFPFSPLSLLCWPF